MILLLLAGGLALLVSFTLTPFCRDLFQFLQLVDVPDSVRKLHRRPIPRVGGIPLMASYTIIAIILLLTAPALPGLHLKKAPSMSLLRQLLPGVAIIFLIGLADDLIGLTPRKKLLGQVIAAAVACLCGIRLLINSPYWWVQALAVVVSVMWLVLSANAFNLIDGLDGLATGVGVLIALSLLIVGALHDMPHLALVAAPLIGGLLGFLYYNFNPASVFLGDCGSLVIGFLIGCLSLVWSEEVAGPGRFSPVIAMAVPCCEVALSILRRYLRQRPIFDADQNHIHHRLLSLGVSHRSATLILYSMSAFGALIAILSTVVRRDLAISLIVFFLAALVLSICRLEYCEFSSFARFLFQGGFRKTVSIRIHIREFGRALGSCHNSQQSWKAIQDVCHLAGIRCVRARIGGAEFATTLASTGCPNTIQFSFASGDTFQFETNAQEAAGLWASLIAHEWEEHQILIAAVKAENPPALAKAARAR